MALVQLGAQLDVANHVSIRLTYVTMALFELCLQDNQTPLHRIIMEKNYKVLWNLVKEMNVDMSWLDEV